MSRAEALENEALGLNVHERATLASDLLYSLPATLLDADDGIREATRRDQDFSESDSCGVTWDDLKKSVGR
jgi:hypothetical protein